MQLQVCSIRGGGAVVSARLVVRARAGESILSLCSLPMEGFALRNGIKRRNFCIKIHTAAN